MNTRSSPAFLYCCAAIVALGMLLVSAPQAQASAITSGDLVLVRVGDGTTAITGSAQAVNLLDYTVNYSGLVPTSVSLSQTIAVQSTSAASAPFAVTQGGTAAGEGGLYRSTNGAFMAFAGYNSSVGAVTNPGAAGTEVRTAGLLNLSTGVVDSTTAYTDALGSNANRGAFTTNGIDIWFATSANGIRYTTVGAATTSTALTSTSNERRVNVFTGQLYTSRQSGTIDGVATVGSGTPTSGTQTVTLLPGFPTATNSMYDYFFADPVTIYTADDRSSGTGGLEKWRFNGSTWIPIWSKLAGGTSGVKSITGTVDGIGNVTLFGASVGTTANKLYGWTDSIDSGSQATLTENLLLDASTAYTGTLWNLRGVAMNAAGGSPTPIPEPASALALMVLALLPLRRRRRR